MIEFNKIVDETQIKKFIDSCSNELETFRYFNSRPHDIFKKHLYSYIIYNNKEPIAYYHVETEGEVNWFGICIIKKYQNGGLGSLIMNHMIYCAKLLNLKSISLTVDINNYAAINLYNKFGFKIEKVNETYLNMKREINHG